MGGAMPIKSLIQFSVDGQGCVLSLLLDVRPDYGGSNEDKRASLVAQTVNHLPAVWETRVLPLGWEDPLEKEMATHSFKKDQFSFQSQRKAMPKNAHTTAQLHSYHTLAKECSKFSKPGFNSM